MYLPQRIGDALDSLQGGGGFLLVGYAFSLLADSHGRRSQGQKSPDGLFEFNVLSFELCNTLAAFEHLVDAIVCGLKWKVCMCYLNDSSSSTFENHLERLPYVVSLIGKAGLKVNSQKCPIFQEKFKALRPCIFAGGLRPDPKRICAVQNVPKPKCVKTLHMFLVLCSYF